MTTREMQAILEESYRMLTESRAAEAKADPKRHKLTTLFEGPANYAYWPAGRDARGAKVRFCWSKHRNVAGYFLGWREVESKQSLKRFDFFARRAKWRARALQLERARRYASERGDAATLKRLPAMDRHQRKRAEVRRENA